MLQAIQNAAEGSTTRMRSCAGVGKSASVNIRSASTLITTTPAAIGRATR